MLKKAALLLLILVFQHVNSQTTLSHNVCDDVIRTSMFSCKYAKFYWARLFELQEFGISNNEEFTITSGQVAIRSSDGGTSIKFNIYEVDTDFPNSFSTLNLIGSSQNYRLPPIGDNNPQIIDVTFDNSILVDSKVNRILVEVEHIIHWGSGTIFIAGTEQDTDLSWYRGCGADENGYVSGGSNGSCNCYITTELLGRPDAKFYINVTGDVNHLTNNFEMNISNICSEFLKEFSLENDTDINSVIWDFGDSASGLENNSTDLSPFHDFSQDGTYTVTATVTSNNGNIEIITETIDVREPPNAYGINNLHACEDSFGTGISSAFDVATVKQQVLGGQTDKVVTFTDGSGNEYDILPDPFTNSVRDIETISVKVAHSDNHCCASETTFDLIVSTKPTLEAIEDLIVCESQTNGFAVFDLQSVKENITENTTNIDVEFYFENGQIINEPLNAVENSVANEELIKVYLINSITNCYNETTFKLKVNPLPIANTLNEIVGCDDNNDGISEYFDTSTVEQELLGNQSGMDIFYFDADGNQLPSPLPNPYTNITANQQLITVRVTNPQTTCFAETILKLNTIIQPTINQPQNLFACDEGNGYAEFNTSLLKEQIIGNQNGLSISYYDANNNQLPNPLPALFKNTIAYSQTITARVEAISNPICFSETSFDLIINSLPEINLEDDYFICDLEPSITLNLNPNLNSYAWYFEDGTLISTNNNAEIINEGNYTLTITETKNNLICENSFSFSLIRSSLPEITQVNHGELGNNYIEIIASGDGDLEYSIDGIYYQNSNYFSNIKGGNYIVFVRDKEGCGEDNEKVVIIDYPKFFTPNSDGYSDYWEITVLNNFPNFRIDIYDRYGKLLTQLSPNNPKWDGFYNGKKMKSSDYWFIANLNNEVNFSGHFALKR